MEISCHTSLEVDKDMVIMLGKRSKELKLPLILLPYVKLEI